MTTLADRRFFCLLLTICLAAFVGCGSTTSSDPPPTLSPPLSSKPDANGLVTQIRPQVARISDNDTLQLVLHWEDDKGPLTRQRAFDVGWSATCDTLTFHITAPDGSKHTLKPQAKKKVGEPSSEFSSSPTLFMKLTTAGVTVDPRNYKSDWEGGRADALEEKGKFQVSVSGELMPPEKGKGAPIPFASETVEIERGVEGYKPLMEVASIAGGAVRKHLEAGFERGGYVYDDADGNRLVHLAGPSSKQWHFKIHTVRVSPEGKVLGVYSREVSNCLAEGTKLEGEHGALAIESVRVGERVWGYDLNRRRVLTTVRDVRRSESSETLRLACGLRLTGEHPVYASGKWMAARELTESDSLLNAEGESVPVGEIERVRGRVAVFDVTVDEPHNFFADGVLVHNKSRPHWPQVDDLWYRLWSPGMK